MVKSRGIEISVISQFDIRRLPEFAKPTDETPSESMAVECYIPIYPGSQIWLEYVIEPPHPPKAAYFFKLSINGRAVTAWDCTEKHGYYGKMIYTLEKTKTQQEYTRTSIIRKGFRFGIHEAIHMQRDESSDYIEIRVHRIEHRQRLRDVISDDNESLDDAFGGQLQLMNGGVLEPGRPVRRYQYQLLDPVDEPYAVFRFFYRTVEYLTRTHIMKTSRTSLRSASSSPSIWHDAPATSTANVVACGSNLAVPNAAAQKHNPARSIEHSQNRLDSLRNKRGSLISQLSDFSQEVYLPLSDSDDLLSAIAKDSIEDLPSTAPPKNSSPSPRQRWKKRLTLDLSSTTCDIEKARRPLSPFTNGGILRRIISPERPPSTPAAVTEFIPTVAEEVGQSLTSRRIESDIVESLTQTKDIQVEKEGKSLMRFLSRRSQRQEKGEHMSAKSDR